MQEGPYYDERDYEADNNPPYEPDFESEDFDEEPDVID